MSRAPNSTGVTKGSAHQAHRFLNHSSLGRYTPHKSHEIFIA
jgi:hypothetical protein